MSKVSVKLRAGMQHNNVAPEVIDQILKAITSFALYGFPESHAISFAILAYGSAYLKAHRAPEFYASLLNNQPMGFYSPATLVKDGRRHGLKVQPVCVLQSEWRCTVVSDDTLQLGFCVVNGMRREHADDLVAQRQEQPFCSIDDFKRRVELTKEELRRLAELGALNCFSEHRRNAMWEVEETIHDDLLVREIPGSACAPQPSPLASMTLPERVQADYAGMNLTTGPHPMKLLRDKLPKTWRAIDLTKAQHGSIIEIAGNVICRQRPGTAKGFVFVSLEDETGVSNAIVAPDLFERLRLVITEEPFLLIRGTVQNSDGVALIKAREIEPLLHGQLAGSESHDFH